MYSTRWIAPYDPVEIQAVQLERPSAAHPLGRDNLGRDILSRVLYGARVSLGAALLALVLIMLVGVTEGLVSGYRGRWIDAVLMRALAMTAMMDFVAPMMGLHMDIAAGPVMKNNPPAVV